MAFLLSFGPIIAPATARPVVRFHDRVEDIARPV